MWNYERDVTDSRKKFCCHFTKKYSRHFSPFPAVDPVYGWMRVGVWRIDSGQLNLISTMIDSYCRPHSTCMSSNHPCKRCLNLTHCRLTRTGRWLTIWLFHVGSLTLINTTVMDNFDAKTQRGCRNRTTLSRYRAVCQRRLVVFLHRMF